jgi:opacity protein-like surface antigen
MRIRLVLAAALVMMATATTAMAKDGPYVTFSGGATFVHDSDIKTTGLPTITSSFDTGGCFNVGGGLNAGPARFEAEFGYKNADLDKLSVPGGSVSVSDMEITVKSYMLNAYFDFKNNPLVTPFIGAGLGLLTGDFKSQGSTDSVNEFGYQFMTGFGFKVTENITLDLSYRFQGAASDFSKDGTSISYHSSNLLVGARYNF